MDDTAEPTNAAEPAGPDQGVAATLRRSSQSFARSGTRAYADETWDVFHLHMATAIEQLVKCVLARINPLFIADDRGRFDTQLHLAGMGHRASSPATAIRTITVSEALDRVRRVLDPYQEPATEVRVLLDARNAAVHLGAATQTAADVVLAESAPLHRIPSRPRRNDQGGVLGRPRGDRSSAHGSSADRDRRSA